MKTDLQNATFRSRFLDNNIDHFVRFPGLVFPSETDEAAAGVGLVAAPLARPALHSYDLLRQQPEYRVDVPVVLGQNQ